MSETLTAAIRDWNPLLHPRGADGRFIEVGSWVRWLRQGFGTTRRGQVKEIIADPNAEVRDGIPTKVIARVEFPDKGGKTIIHDVPTEELEKVAPPKGSIDESESESNLVPAMVENLAHKAVAQGIGHAIRDDEHEVGEDDEDEENNLESPLYGLVISRALEVEDAEYNVGDTVTYKVIAENQGSVETGEYSFDDPVPEGLEFISATGDGTFAGTSVSWTDRPSLEPGGAASVTVTAKVLDPALLLKQKTVEEKPADGITVPDEVAASLMASLRSKVRGESETVVARATAYWTEEKRQEAAQNGVALPDGKYPIEDREDLRKSIAAYGRSQDPIATKRHIMRRASIIGSLDLLPDDWAGSPGFDPARHLRGPDGKFISQGGSPQRSSAFVASTTAEDLRGRVHGTD